MLFGNGKVASLELLQELALAREGHGPDLGAGQLLARGPVNAGRALVKGMEELVGEGVLHVLLGEEPVLAEDDAVGGRKATAAGQVAGGTAKVLLGVEGTAGLGELVHHEADQGRALHEFVSGPEALGMELVLSAVIVHLS